MLHRRSFLVLLGALPLLPRRLRAASSPAYTVVAIPASPGTNSPSPTGINQQGVVVGVLFSTDQTGATVVDAFTFHDGQTTLLNRVGARSYADAINATGAIAGSSVSADGKVNQAVKWENGIGVFLTSPNGESSAYSINDAGDLAGSATVTTNGASWTHAAKWSGDAFTDLGTLGGDSSEASSINAGGQIAGASGTKAGAGSLLLDDTAHAFLWTNGVMVDLGTLGGDSSSANALNDKGQVVGWSGTKPGGGALAFDPGAQAFVVDGGQMVGLGGLGDAGISSASAINNNGLIAGYAIDAANGQRAVIWKNASIVDLNTLIPAGSGLTLLAAYDINDAGQIVCGAKSADGSFSGVVLDPAT
jgi:probable HAF family extracellular repeat protein